MAAEEKAQVEEINAQYDATAEKLQEKAEGEDYDILGFLAYDIKFVDEEGHKTEPDGSVSVTMDYKEAAIPEEVKKAQEDGTEIADVTLMHLEEHSNGEVKDVIDMVADESQEASVQTTANTEVEKAEFATESFSVFTLTWKGKTESGLTIQAVDTEGISIGEPGTTENITREETVTAIAGNKFRISGYTFLKATLNSINGTEIKRLKCESSGGFLSKKTYTWYYNTNESSTKGWEKVNGNTICFVYRSDLVDLEGNAVSTTQHQQMINEASQENLPITWKRSATYNYNLHHGQVSDGLWWKWSDVTFHLNDLNITDASQIWDGSRLAKHNLNNTAYLAENTITAYRGKLYDSATWAITGDGKNEALNRFRGEFSLKSLSKENGYDYADYDYTIKSVVDDEFIYVNDNMFVFVYPKSVTLTDDNYMDYLAFWTGSSNRNGSIESYNGRLGTAAYLTNKDITDGNGGNPIFWKITNGWFAKPVTDGAGGIIQKALSDSETNTEYYIDVITHDNGGGGGMYRLEINAQKKEKTPVSFYKVDADDTSRGIQGAKFTLTSEKGATYFFTSGTDGKTNEIKLVPGTYTLKENVAGNGYLGSDNEWTVTVAEDGFSIALNGTGDENATAGRFTSGSNNGKWYITNKKNGTTPTPPTTDQDLGKPEHKKTILKQENNYRLSLDVKGEVGQATPIDVLLIVDESNSMEDDGKTNVDKAVAQLVGQLKASDIKDNIKIAIVGFSGTKRTLVQDSPWSFPYYKDDEPYNDARTRMEWKKVTELGASPFGLTVDGGTNWQAGVREGEKVLASGTSGAKKYVVFLTDGNPTYKYDDKGMTTGEGDTYKEEYLTAAVTEWNSTTHMKNAVKYIIDANNEDKSKCSDFASKVGAEKLDGTNEATLTAAFEEIAKDITKPEYTKVSITDTLSDYADFADAEHLNLKVYAQKDGETKSELSDSEYEVVWDKDGKTVTVKLLNQKALKEKVTYTVEFNIKPTLKAYADYAKQNGYGGTKGDLNTDTDTANPTSSDKPGFHSNATAKVTYTVNGKEDHAEYAHPVLQVEQEITEHSVKKEWVGGTGESVNVKLVAKYENAEKNQQEVPNDFQSLTADMRKEQTLTENTADASKNWAYTWKNLPKYYYYTDKDGKLAQTEIVYSVEEVNPSNKYNVTYAKSEDGTLTTITNTAKAKWEIVKVSSNSNDVKLEGAEFTLTDAKNPATTYTGTSGADGVVTWKDANNNDVSMIPEGAYTLKETKAPGNYALSEDTWTITVGKDGSLTVKDASGKTVDCVTTEETDADGNKTGVVIYSYYFKNTPMYELPSTGGIGTYWYTIGGMLMMAAALVLYRKKKYTK